MKVVHICMYDFGGAGNAAYRLHAGLVKLGINSFFLVADKKNNDDKVIIINNHHIFDKKDTSIWDKQVQRWKDISIKYPNKPIGFETFTDPFSDFNLANIEEVNSADVINFHWIAGIINFENLPGAFLNKPIVWTLHDMNAFTGGCHYAGDCRKYENECYRCNQLGSGYDKDDSFENWNIKHRAYQQLKISVVTPSKWLADCAKNSSLFANNSISVIPYGLDLDVFKPIDNRYVRKNYNINESAILLLFGAATITNKRKGFDYLIKALRKLSATNIAQEIVLGIFGNIGGFKSNDLKFKVIHFGSITDNERLSAIYSSGDAFIIPSLEDNLPNTVLESLACGTPVIGFNTGGIPDMVEHKKNGYLAETQNIDDLVNGILWLSSLSKNQKDFLSLECRKKTVDCYALELQATNYVQLYNKLINQAIYPTNQEEDVLNLTTLNKNAKKLSEAGLIDDAISDFNKILAIQPDYFNANFNLGILYYQTKELKKSVHCYLKCLTSKPNDRNTIINLVYVLIEMNKRFEAEKIVSTYLIDNYDDKEMMNLLNFCAENKFGLQKINSEINVDEKLVAIVNIENKTILNNYKPNIDFNKTIKLDYPTTSDNSPRWGWAKEPHTKLTEIIGRRRSDYELLLKQFMQFIDQYRKISIDLDPINPHEPNIKNSWLPGLDSLSIYCLLPIYKPKIYLEVGSGNSTKFARKSISDSGLSTKIISIDPQPRAEINSICDYVIRKPLENVGLEIFDLLEKNDILFIDNSHRSFMNSDVTVFFLDILPRLKPGVIVQIHDIQLPYDYPKQWDKRYYNEQYLLASYLLAEGNKFKILLPNAYISWNIAPELKEMVKPFFKGMEEVSAGGGSFWIQIN